MGLFSSIFGGSSQKSTSSSNSYNKAYEPLFSNFSPVIQEGLTGVRNISALLGGDTSGFDTFKRTTGFDAASEAGSRGITGNAAASGLLRSGSTAKGLQAYGNQMQNNYYQNYLDSLFKQANLGFTAGGLLSGAGGVNQSTGSSSGSSSPGIGGFLGSILGGVAASDPRLKTDVHYLYSLDNGLGVYEFTYINGHGPFVGVMADEVADIQPEALGPVIDGYMTVDYSKINLEI